MEPEVHTPILTDAILEYLRPAPGHSFIDRDAELLDQTRTRLAGDIESGRLTLAHGNFRDLEEIAQAHGFAQVHGVIFDLGLSSYHLDRSRRGFSFGADEPLDMRFDANDSEAESAAEIVNSRREEELANLIYELGEERFSRRIARAIVRRRESAPLHLTSELYDLIVGALPGPARRHADRSAARVFQALRIAANDELGAVRAVLPQAVSLLRPGGRIAVLSFHSLEDRIVKYFFRALKQKGELEILTKKPLRAGDAEVAANPRASSAKLRVAERTE